VTGDFRLTDPYRNAALALDVRAICLPTTDLASAVSIVETWGPRAPCEARVVARAIRRLGRKSNG